MSNEEKKQTLPAIGKKLDESVSILSKSDVKTGFERAYLIAQAASDLSAALTPEYMKPIMSLCGKQIGFRTDKDTANDKYPEDVVKNCLIEAVVNGVEPFGNQFNIIAGRCYITKEGYGHLLSKVIGLSYNIVFELPRMNDKSAAVKAIIRWQISGVKQEQTLDLPVKVNSFMGADGVIGKAERKARKWLYQTVTGCEVPDGDTEDVEAKVMESKPVVDKTQERYDLLLNDCKTIEEVQILFQNNPQIPSEKVDARIAEIEMGVQK